MLTLTTGTPGSGKTLRIIDKLLKISNGEISQLSHIQNVYNNIAGFDFSKFEESEVSFYKLDFKALYEHLSVLYALYIENESKDNVDDVLINYCKEHDIFDSYFVIDECHNFFDNQDKVKMWWLTYHRHLHHELDFITQNKQLINTKYRNIPELFIEAQPRSKAISKNTMRYFHYTDFRMSKRFETSSITVSDKHFSVYKSGNVSKQKLVGQKYLYMFVLFFISMIFIFYYLFKSMTPNVPTEDIKENEVKEKQLEKEDDSKLRKELNIQIEDYNKLKYMSLICNTKEKYCTYNKKRIPTQTYFKFKELFDIQELAVTPLFNNYVQLDILAHEYFYFIFYGGMKNEKDSLSNINPIDTN